MLDIRYLNENIINIKILSYNIEIERNIVNRIARIIVSNFKEVVFNKTS